MFRAEPPKERFRKVVAQTPEGWIRENSQYIAGEFYKRYFDNALRLYRALPAAIPFHRCDAHLRLVVGSNRAGKTTTAVAEVARILRGKHPKRPKTNGKMLAVGLDEEHIAPNMWEKMSLPGLFRVVPDEITGAPRAVRPDPKNPRDIDPIDLARKELWKPSPPFLPPEEWDYPGGIVWRDKAKNCPGMVRVRSTGWRIWFYPSGGHPRRGIDVDDAWFDEEVVQQLWFTETMPRLVDRNGHFLWSATPQTDTEELLKIHRRFQGGDPGVSECSLFIEDNPYLPKEAKKRLYADLEGFGQEVLDVRYYGRWGILGRQVYGQHDMNRLGTDDFDV